LPKVSVTLNERFYWKYPDRQQWGKTNYVIQTSWKQGVCEKRRKTDKKHI